MEIIRKRLSYYDFDNVVNHATGSTLFELNQIISAEGLGTWTESVDYTSFVTGFLTTFPDNFLPFSTSAGLVSSVTVVNAPGHGLTTQEQVALVFTTGQAGTGLYEVAALGDQLGASPGNNFLLLTPFTQASTGYLSNVTDEALSFFKGFNIEPTAASVDALQGYLTRYLSSPDLKALGSTSVGEFLTSTPRRVFNDLGFTFVPTGTASTIPTQWGYLSGTTITLKDDPVFNLTVFLTQTIDNLGIYSNYYTGDTDNRSVGIVSDGQPDDFLSYYGTNDLLYYFNDGVGLYGYAYTGLSQFWETLYSVITGTTENKSALVSAYKDLTADQKGDAIAKYKLSLIPAALTYTIERNDVVGINDDNKVEYTTSRPIIKAKTAKFKVYSHGLHPLNGNVYDMTGRTAISASYFDEFNIGLVDNLRYDNDVRIDRGVFSVFENHYKLPFILTLSDLESFENGEFNVTKQD